MVSLAGNCGLSQALAQGFSDSLGFGVDLQLFVDVPDVEADGIKANPEVGRRRFIVVAFD